MIYRLSMLFMYMIGWLAITIVTVSVRAETDPDPLADRQQFLEAETALKLGQYSRYRTLLHGLEEYPLYPYLLYQDLLRRLPVDPNEEIRAFLNDWHDSPLAERLRSRWLRRLAQQNRWSQYLTYYTVNSSVARRCDYLSAMINTGRGDEIVSEIEQLWLHGHSQPDQCDGVFSHWRAAGYLTRTLAWARIRLAVKAGETALAGYLKRFVDISEHTDVDLWIKTRIDPNRIAATHLYPANRPLAHEALVIGVQFLARRDAEKAAKLWVRIFPERHWSDNDIVAIERQIGLSLAYNHKPQAIAWLSKGPHESDARVREWRVLSALRHQKWAVALQWLSKMSREEQRDSRWRYWRARCQQVLGDGSQSSAEFTNLSEERSYYGFLAADRLGLSYQFQRQALHFPEPDVQSIASLPGIERAKELYALQRWPDARREWYFVIKSLSENDTAIAAKIAQRWGWHARAILTVATTSRRNDLALRFPTPHRSVVIRWADDNGLEPAWVFAIARQESAFMPDARSAQGALGLMQIMPSTGKDIAKKLNTAGFRTRLLLNSDTNFRFGSWYLRHLMNQMGDHEVLTIASYNAGPNRTRRWLPDSGVLDADVWVETVPFRETRRYLRRVLAYTVIYKMLLGDPLTRMSARLLPVPSSL